MTAAETRRVFFALWPAAATADALYRQAGAWQSHCRGRVMRCDTLHMTLFFAGNVSATQLTALIEVADGVDGESCVMRLDTCGRWRHNRIVWAGTSHPPAQLSQLVGSLTRALKALGYRSARETFMPHVTLLRNTERVPQSAGMPALDWNVNEFVLVESQLRAGGAHYRCLKRWRLREMESGWQNGASPLRHS